MKPTFFSQSSDFRKWLEKNHSTKAELIVGFYKVGSGQPSMTWSQSVDQALCFGWIDGVRRSIDKHRYQIRFTPRKPGSTWSTVNIEKVKVLTKQGLMQEAGLAIFKKRTKSKSGIYSHENEEMKFSPGLNKQLKENKKAWKFFRSLAPSYRKASTNWVMSAKQEATQTKRMNMLIADCEAGINQWKNNKYNTKKYNL